MASYGSIGDDVAARQTALDELLGEGGRDAVLTSKEFELKKVLDLTDRELISQLNIRSSDLIQKNDYELTQLIGSIARENGFDALIVPSYAHFDGVNVVILR